MGEETGAEGKGGGSRGLPGTEKGTLTQPGWQLLGPRAGGEEPPAGAFHPLGQRGALGRGGGDLSRASREGQGSGSGLRKAGVAAPRTGPLPPTVYQLCGRIHV